MPTDSPRHLVLVAVAFEGALGLVGWGICWLAGIPLGASLWPAQRPMETLLLGLVATLPLLLLLVLLLKSRLRGVVDLVRKVRGLLRLLFARGTTWQVALVALMAGFGEEILFRGAVQPLFVSWTGPLVGVGLASLLFGLVHAASATYFLFASLVGLYLGGLAYGNGEILSACIAHALYDFLAIEYLVRRPRRGRLVGP